MITYGCERWTVKKAEFQRIDAFELWCWRSPLDSKEIKPEYSLEGLMLKLKGRYFGHLMMQTDDSLEKSLVLGKMEGWRRRGRQRMRWLNCITDAVNMNLGNSGRWWGLACCSPGGRTESDTTGWLNSNVLIEIILNLNFHLTRNGTFLRATAWSVWLNTQKTVLWKWCQN